MMRLPQTKEDKKREKMKHKRAQQGERLDDFSEMDKIKDYFKEQQKIKVMKEDEKDKLLKKTLADFITRRKQEKEEGFPIDILFLLKYCFRRR
jgi:4-alpha-glucanotransferase